LRAEQILQDRLFADKKINVIWNATVEEILGDETVNAVKIKSTDDGSIMEYPTNGVFVAIGHDPATSIFKGHVNMDSEGYIVTKPDSTETNIPGVFAAGDVKDKIYRQAVTAAGMGCMAALEAEKFLSTSI
jgi:thioredoxin reductase (NADPH)